MTSKYAHRVILYVNVGALIFFLLWGSYFKIDHIVKSQGQIIADSRTQTIQSIDGGAVSAIYVKEGDAVKSGQLLATLEKDRADTAYKQAKAKMASNLAALARVRAIISDKPLKFDPILNDYPEFVAVQRGLYEKQRKSMVDQLSALVNMQKNLAVEVDANERLLTTEDIGNLDVLRTRRQLIEVDGKIADLRNKFLQDISSEFAKLEEEYSQNEQITSDRHIILEHSELRSPVSGVVKAIKVTTLGGVLRPGEELMQISPTDAEMILEAKVNPTDVGSLTPGLPVTVRLDAYDYTIWGVFHGALVNISPDTITEERSNGQSLSYYRVKIRLPSEQSHNPKAKDVAVKLGMTASVDIRVGTRTIMQYLFTPVLKAFSGALGEQ